MENLETIIELLYKRTSIQKVIRGDIKCDDFNENEFMSMVTAYVFHYSENESWNLLNYFLDTFQESAKRKGRKIERKLNVFEPLFYYAQEFLLIRDNEVLCHYPRLLEWREITTALSEDLLISAFFAGELTHAAMQTRGYAWKTVIGHDNAQLNAVIRRGISENHSHLNGAAPIFHISWLSLMNNINTSKLGQQLRAYDKERRYTSVAYTSGYTETSFHRKYLQAALIRLLLYCKICGKRFKFGAYEIRTSLILNYIIIPDFTYNNQASVPSLDKDIADQIIIDLNECSKSRHTLRETILYTIRTCTDSPDWNEIWKQNRVLEKLLESNTGNYLLYKNQIIEVILSNIGVPLSKVFLKLLFLIDKISLEDIQELFFDKKIFKSLWEKRTLDNVKELLQSPCLEDLIREQDYIQSVIDVFKLGEDSHPQEFKNLDYILDHLKPSGSQEDKHNFIFSGERWLIYTMLRKVYLNDNEYFNYFNLFYAYLLIKESIRSELIQSNKNVGFTNFQKYQKRKGDLLADNIYKNEFTRLAVSNTLATKYIRKIELRIAPKNDLEKMCSHIQLLDRLILPNKFLKKRIFYTIHFIKSPEKPQKDTTYMYCRHYNKRKNLEKEAYALSGLREKYPYIGERILGIDAAANEIGCRPEVFAPIFRYLKNHRHGYYTANGLKKLPQLSATYHVGEDFLDLADGLRAIDEAVLFLNLESGDRLGHALALGIDVKEWYQIKRYRIALPAQDYLDNLVWVFHKIVQYDIRDFENLKEWIQAEYTVLFGQI